MIYTLQEAADILKVSTLTIKRWEARGYITCIRIGPMRIRRVSQEEIDRILGRLKWDV